MGEIGPGAFMILEHLTLVPFGPMRPGNQAALGNILADLHLSKARYRLLRLKVARSCLRLHMKKRGEKGIEGGNNDQDPRGGVGVERGVGRKSKRKLWAQRVRRVAEMLLSGIGGIEGRNDNKTVTP